MEELVVARLLMGVLGRDDAQVAREVTEAEEFLREVDDVVVQYERVRPRDVERDSGHGASQVCHCSAWAPPSSAISATGGEVAMHASLCGDELVGRDTPASPVRLQAGRRRRSAPGQEHEGRAEGQVHPERDRRLAVGPVRGDESEADDSGEDVGVEEPLQERDQADPGQREAYD